MNGNFLFHQFDVSEPSPERQIELDTEYERQKAITPDAPYKDVRIQTLGELNWIMRQRQWSGEVNSLEGMTRANLSNAYFTGVDLTGAHLGEANLRNSRIIGTRLYGADLHQADLTGAFVFNTNLSGASLDDTVMCGTILYRLLLDTSTSLDGATIDTETRMLGIQWNGASLEEVNWEKAPHLYEPQIPTRQERAKARQERANGYRMAERGYHGLVIELHNQGLFKLASRYRLREHVMQRNALWYERSFGGWLLNVLLGAVAGHGEKSGRAFGWYLGVVTFFAATYWAWSNFIHTQGQQRLNPLEAIVLSFISFHGRGFFINPINLSDPLAIFGALEAVIGLFIELVFIATFSRRFLGD